MADCSESRMNLAALQRVDSNITDIIDTASQVALYKFNSKSSEWERTEIEGTLFVYTRSLVPSNGFIIMNRLSITNLVEPITHQLEFQLQDPFLLYRNANYDIFGIWFYDKDECARIGQLMNSLTQWASADKQELKMSSSQRLRRASESDKLTNIKPSSNENSDIISLLNKALNEYKLSSSPSRKSHKSLNGTDQQILKPTPMKQSPNEKQPPTSLSVEALFASAEVSSNDNRNPIVSPTFPKTDPQQSRVLQRLKSNPANTLEHIERQMSCKDKDAERSSAAEVTKNDLKEKLRLLTGVNDRVVTTPENKERPVVMTPEMFMQPLKRSAAADITPLKSPVSNSKVSNYVPSSVAATPPLMMTSSLNINATMLPLLTPMAFQSSSKPVNVLSTSLNSGIIQDSPMSVTSVPVNNYVAIASNGVVHPEDDGITMGIKKSPMKITPLTESQLSQALIHLLQNDSEFVSKLHSAYVDSLETSLQLGGTGKL